MFLLLSTLQELQTYSIVVFYGLFNVISKSQTGISAKLDIYIVQSSTVKTMNHQNGKNINVWREKKETKYNMVAGFFLS